MTDSNVTLIMTIKSYEIMLKFFHSNSKKYREVLKLIEYDISKKIEYENFISLNWEKIKWYRVFKEIDDLLIYLDNIKKEIDMIDNITDKIFEEKAWELIEITENGRIDFKCYDELNGLEGKVNKMPILKNKNIIYNELEEKSEQIDIYNVVYLTNNNTQGAYNEVVFTTTSKLKAQIKLRELYDSIKTNIIENYLLEAEEENIIIDEDNLDNILFQRLQLRDNYAEIETNEYEIIYLNIFKNSLIK